MGAVKLHRETAPHCMEHVLLRVIIVLHPRGLLQSIGAFWQLEYRIAVMLHYNLGEISLRHRAVPA